MCLTRNTLKDDTIWGPLIGSALCGLSVLIEKKNVTHRAHVVHLGGHHNHSLLLPAVLTCALFFLTLPSPPLSSPLLPSPYPSCNTLLQHPPTRPPLVCKQRRAELACYVAPRAIQAAWYRLHVRGLVRAVPFTDFAMLVATSAMMVVMFEEAPRVSPAGGIMKPFIRSLIRLYLGREGTFDVSAS